MYVTKLQIANIRSLQRFSLNLPPGGGWHVIVGPNGSGKSTVIRAFALAMLGEGDIEACNEDLALWIRAGAATSSIAVETTSTEGESAVSEIHLKRSGDTVRAIRTAGRAGTSKRVRSSASLFSASFGPYRRLTGSDATLDELYVLRPTLGAHLSALTEKVGIPEAERWLAAMYLEEVQAERDVQHWFARIDQTLLRSFLAAVDGVPARDSDVAFTEAEETRLLSILGDEISDYEAAINHAMHYGAINIALPLGHQAAPQKGDPAFDLELIAVTLRSRLASFFNNSGFLFDELKIREFRPDGVYVVDRAGAKLSISQLSDGYRSVIGLGLEIIRLMQLAFGREALLKSFDQQLGSVMLPGVVAIDEIEAHLHPTWQETVGTWLRRCFPLVQFIVTTHSPIVCRSILFNGKIVGSVWKLPLPGGEGALERMDGIRLERLVYGNLSEAISTDAFGRQIARSKGAYRMLERLARLNRQAAHGEELDAAEREELDMLRATFPVGTGTPG